MSLWQHMFDIMIIEIYPLKSMQPNHPKWNKNFDGSSKQRTEKTSMAENILKESIF